MSGVECDGTRILLLMSVHYSVRINFKYLQLINYLSEIFLDRNTLTNILLWNTKFKIYVAIKKIEKLKNDKIIIIL